MSKRTRAKPAPPTAPSPLPSAPPSLGAEVLRRMLLAALVLILVARPFVRGEDPGLLSDFSDPGAMVLTLIALLACSGWAAWRLWSPGAVYLGAAEVGLFALTLLCFVGAAFAPYSRAAYFAAAEWLGLALLLFLARQLAVRPEDQQGLAAALLATAVALSVQGVFQLTNEFPRLAREAETPEKVVADFTAVRLLNPTPLEQHQLTEQLRHRIVSGPYFHPASLAACLVLLLPVMAGSLVACVRGGSPRWVTGGVGACLLLAAVVLGLTRSAPAVAALALAGLPWASLYWPARYGGARAGFGLGLAAAAAVVAVLCATGRLTNDLALWREAWPAAWRLVEDHFWRGVGPAQFRFYYPRYMAESAGFRLADPSSSALELMAEMGVGGVLLLGLALATLFVAARRWWRVEPPALPPGAAAPPPGSGVNTGGDGLRGISSPAPAKAAPPGSDESSAGQLRWEYYLGGMLAAVLSFTLRANSMLVQDVGPEAFAAGARSVVWFFAFALFERVSWTPGEYVGSLLVGIVGVLLAFLVGPGLAYPGVAGLLWVCVALVLAVVRPAPAAWPGKSPALKGLAEKVVAPRFFAGLGLPVFAGVGLGYFAFVLYPAATAADKARQARWAAAEFHIDRARKPEDRKIHRPLKYIDESILKPLLLANREDPGNTRTLTLLASWTVQRWALAPLEESNRGRARPPGSKEEGTPGMDEKASAWAALARAANPEDVDGYRAEYEVLERRCQVLALLAQRLDQEAKKNKKLTAVERKENRRAAADLRSKIEKGYEAAAKALKAALPRDPTNPLLHFLMASARLQAGDAAGAKEAAAEAERLDRVVGRPRSLSDRQREQLTRWLGGQSSR